ncbi:methylamine utilization protein MauG [Pasteurellaceae bacterium LFhippo2]|nr:methylamine utilization protein MauG [Pasteurellaceae bacterium LFhippo2]
MRTVLAISSLFIATSLQALESESRTELPPQGMDKAMLGQILFFDKTLSFHGNQNCATCHNQDHAFIDVRDNSAERMVSLGDDLKSFGKRNTQTMLYGRYVPEFHFDEKLKEYVGGQFWDGRALNLQEQAGKPPLDPLEMGMPDQLSVAKRLWQSPMHSRLLTQLYGAGIWEKVETVYASMEDAIATFQKEKRLLAPFSSKYDKSLKGEYQLTDLEQQGKTLFFDKNQTNCSNCHQLHTEVDHKEETFSNYRYYNIGVPSNKKLIAHNQLPEDFIDNGLLDNPRVNGDVNQKGKFKVPTLRNVAVTAPYMHNGVFNELRTVLLFLDHFNNPERKLNPETKQVWSEAEYHPTLAKDDLKAKPLTDQEIDALEAFLKILTDERYEKWLK